MVSNLQKVRAIVLERVTPDPEERKRILALAEQLNRKVILAAKEARVEADVRVEGSVAKDTWLSQEPDIDIFMRLPTSMPRKAFSTIGLDIAKKATHGSKQIERFAEHPYLESLVNGVRVNIVPCYRVEKGEWLSATDRTPFHTDYVKPLLDKETCGEIRLLKKFMRGIGIYGAEIKVGGFSGYLCELLTLHYGSFLQVLESAADWKGRVIIDFEGHYKGREEAAERLFEEPFIVVDPVDKGRNTAAAVRAERFFELIVAARAFLKRPELDFFYPKPKVPLDAERLKRALNNKGSALVLLELGNIEAVPDILWGQLYKSKRALRNLLERKDFNVIRDSLWGNEEDLNVFFFEVEHPSLPRIREHLGPPIRKRADCEKFLQKHLGAVHTVSGPRVENGRWVVEIRREYTDVKKLLLEKLKRGGRKIGVATLISQAFTRGFKVLIGKEILELYFANAEFARFLTDYLEGKPSWLK